MKALDFKSVNEFMLIQYTTMGEPVYTDIIFHCSSDADHSYFEYSEKAVPAETNAYTMTDGSDIYLSSEPEYHKSNDAVPICFTALTADRDIWADAISVIKDIMEKENH